MLTEIQSLKIKLMAHGLVVTGNAKEELILEGKVLSYEDYPTTNGLFLQIDKDIFVNAPINEKSTIILDFSKNFSLIDSEKIFPVKIYPPPNYFGKKNKENEVFGVHDVTHLDRIRVSPINGCAFRCKFCNSWLEKYYKKDVKDLIEVITTAINDSILPAKHILISGGTPALADNDYLDMSYKEITRKFSPQGVPVDIMLAPRKDLKYIDLLYSWGVNDLSINLEVWNDKIAKEIIPQRCTVNKDGRIKFIERGVKVFGKTRIRSALLIGLEPIQDTLEGVEKLASIGCVPMLSPFRPSPDTPLAKISQPTVEQMVEVYQKSSEICKKYDVKLGPRCIPCMHNTLTFPDGSPFYFYY